MLHKRKSQVFLFDIIITFLFLLITVGIIFSLKVENLTTGEVYSTNLEAMEDLTTTKINALNNDYVIKLFRNNKIKNIDYTIGQQVAYFYYKAEYGSAENLTRSYVSNIVGKKMGINISLSGHTLYYNSTTPIGKANTAFVTTRSIFGFYNKTDKFGPYNLTVKTWQ